MMARQTPQGAEKPPETTAQNKVARLFTYLEKALALDDNIVRDFAVLASSKTAFWLLIAGIATLTIAELFIGFSILGKNATVAGLIEISYPLFIALFSYLVFKENHLTLTTGLGAALIFTGVGIIYAFNR